MTVKRDNSEVVNAVEAARMLGVHLNTLKRTPLPFFRIGQRGDRRYRRVDLEDYMRQRSEP